LIQPDPRDIDEIIWCKLTYAAATLTEEDYSVSLSGNPLAYYRAVALLLVTSARRPKEIIRLQLGCIRRDWDPAMWGEDGIPLPGQETQLCYLFVPASKTKVMRDYLSKVNPWKAFFGLGLLRYYPSLEEGNI
jgi:hypothetical protein